MDIPFSVVRFILLSPLFFLGTAVKQFYHSTRWTSLTPVNPQPVHSMVILLVFQYFHIPPRNPIPTGSVRSLFRSFCFLLASFFFDSIHHFFVASTIRTELLLYKRITLSFWPQQNQLCSQGQYTQPDREGKGWRVFIPYGGTPFGYHLVTIWLLFL